MKGKERKELKKTYRILAIVFACVLAVLFLANIVRVSRDRSGSEDLDATLRPEVTWQSVNSGTFAEDFEAFAEDRFAGKNLLRRIYTGFDRLGGAKEENGILRGKKSQLMEDIVSPDSLVLSQKTAGINSYAATHPDVRTHILLVPDAAGILSSRLPAFTTVTDQSELFRAVRESLSAGIVWMDGITAMQRHSDEKIYYKTERYWTTEGAYQVFLETAPDLGIGDPYEIVYESGCAACDFNGSLAEESGFLLGKREEIDVYIPDVSTSCLVTYTDEKQTVPSLYRAEALSSGQKYDVFLGGDHPLIEIDTGSDSSRVLLIVKDSFANCFIPFLVPYYTRIVVADPETCPDGIDKLTADYGVTDTLFLYGGNSFFEDRFLPEFLGSSVLQQGN